MTKKIDIENLRDETELAREDAANVKGGTATKISSDDPLKVFPIADTDTLNKFQHGPKQDSTLVFNELM
jgi:hypothetical protein